MSLNLFTLTLLEATVTLYPSNADGSPDITAPIWIGVQAENLAIRERWVKTETRPTGARYPRKHPLVQQYEISLGRVWAFEIEDKVGFVTGSQKYVLDIVWLDEDKGYWHRETAYQVTISERSRTSKAIDEGFLDDQVFEAEFIAPPSGGKIPAPEDPSGTRIPDVSLTLPLVVKYADQFAVRELYVHDPATHAFTEVTGAHASSYATVLYNPDQSGTFEITFNGEPDPALLLATDGTLNVAGLLEGVPLSSQVPRVEFWYGSLRLASLLMTGELYSSSFEQATPTSPDDLFKIYAGAALRMSISGPGVIAQGFAEA